MTMCLLLGCSCAPGVMGDERQMVVLGVWRACLRPPSAPPASFFISTCFGSCMLQTTFFSKLKLPRKACVSSTRVILKGSNNCWNLSSNQFESDRLLARIFHFSDDPWGLYEKKIWLAFFATILSEALQLGVKLMWDLGQLCVVNWVARKST